MADNVSKNFYNSNPAKSTFNYPYTGPIGWAAVTSYVGLTGLLIKYSDFTSTLAKSSPAISVQFYQSSCTNLYISFNMAFADNGTTVLTSTCKPVQITNNSLQPRRVCFSRSSIARPFRTLKESRTKATLRSTEEPTKKLSRHLNRQSLMNQFKRKERLKSRVARRKRKKTQQSQSRINNPKHNRQKNSSRL